MARKLPKAKKRTAIMSTKTIVAAKIAAACLLFFSCALFFFQYMDVFYNDLINFNPFVLIFFAGIIFVCAYVVNLAGHIEDDNLFLADRYDWVYKIVVAVLVISCLVRIFFIKLNVSVFITVLFIVSALIVLLIPRIVDNDNSEF